MGKGATLTDVSRNWQQDSIADRLAKSRLIWGYQGRTNQQAPTGNWLTWLILSGRGWGKTRTGAEWLAWNAVRNNGTRWAIVAPTFSDARDTCVEGESGLLSVLNRYEYVSKWNRSLGEIELLNGSRIKLFSGDEPERLRGPQHHGAWVDELAAFRYSEAWDQLQFGLRLGDVPQTVVTTTPKPIPMIKTLLKRDGVVVTRGSTFENADNLSSAALRELQERYEGTRLGRQELYGEVLEDVEGALWNFRLLDETRLDLAPDLEQIVVAIDPAVTSGATSDDTGIVTAGRAGGDFYIINDLTMKAPPLAWAEAAIAEYHRVKANYIVAESNQGGDLIKQVLATVDPRVPVKTVTATRGKYLRAEPVAALWEQHKVHMVGRWVDLEDQMCSWTPADQNSPDRLDAMVHAVTFLNTKHTKPVRTFRT
jgi:phage terminase large subunit-like protein